MIFKIKDSDIDGKGCFAAKVIRKNETFTFPVIVFNKEELGIGLKKFSFPWSPNKSSLLLSEITFCNSSLDPNFKILCIDKTANTKTFIALRDIDEDEEILLKY